MVSAQIQYWENMWANEQLQNIEDETITIPMKLLDNGETIWSTGQAIVPESLYKNAIQPVNVDEKGELILGRKKPYFRFVTFPIDVPPEDNSKMEPYKND